MLTRRTALAWSALCAAAPLRVVAQGPAAATADFGITRLRFASEPEGREVLGADDDWVAATGEFYRRELPCLLAVLQNIPKPDVIVIDGYVWLGSGHSGLGAHLYDALNQTGAVVGVAKSRFHSADAVASPVVLGAS